MRVYVHFEDTEDEADKLTIKITLPKKWKAGPTENIKNTFLDAYNKKHPEKEMTAAEVHLTTGKGHAVAADAVVTDVFEDREDVYVKKGPSPEKSDPAARTAAALAADEAAKAAAASASASASASGASESKEGMVRCRNYGCNQWYKEEDNADDACSHHVKPPIFHEAKKGWSCCPERTVWDWDEFMKLDGCTKGRHSTVDPKVKFAASPTVSAASSAGGSGGPTPVSATSAAAAATAASAPAPVMRTAADFNRENPDAASAAGSAARLVASGPPKAAPRSDGKGVCIHNGCKAEFVVAENTDTSCRYHSGQPVFHDGGKYWSCCPTQVKYDFDDFLAVPGCETGPHDDGTSRS